MSPLSSFVYILYRSDQRGVFLAVVSLEGPVFVCSGLVSKGIKVLGYTSKLIHCTYNVINAVVQFIQCMHAIIESKKSHWVY